MPRAARLFNGADGAHARYYAVRCLPLIPFSALFAAACFFDIADAAVATRIMRALLHVPLPRAQVMASCVPRAAPRVRRRRVTAVLSAMQRAPQCAMRSYHHHRIIMLLCARRTACYMPWHGAAQA